MTTLRGPISTLDDTVKQLCAATTYYREHPKAANAKGALDVALDVYFGEMDAIVSEMAALHDAITDRDRQLIEVTNLLSSAEANVQDLGPRLHQAEVERDRLRIALAEACPAHHQPLVFEPKEGAHFPLRGWWHKVESENDDAFYPCKLTDSQRSALSPSPTGAEGVG